MLKESSRQQPERDRKPKVAWLLENYLPLIPIMGASTGHLDWLLYPNHPELFSVIFPDEETKFQNSLLLVTQTVQIDFVQCYTASQFLVSFCSEKRSAFTWRLEVSTWKLHSKSTRTCWPLRTERLKPEFQHTQTHWSKMVSWVSAKKLLKTVLLQQLKPLHRI